MGPISYSNLSGFGRLQPADCRGLHRPAARNARFNPLTHNGAYNVARLARFRLARENVKPLAVQQSPNHNHNRNLNHKYPINQRYHVSCRLSWDATQIGALEQISQLTNERQLKASRLDWSLFVGCR